MYLQRNIFLVSVQKVRVFWPLRYSKKRIFSTLSKKNYVLALATNKGCPKSQFTCDLGHSLLLWPWVKIYYLHIQGKKSLLSTLGRRHFLPIYVKLCVKSRDKIQILYIPCCLHSFDTLTRAYTCMERKNLLFIPCLTNSYSFLGP